MNAVAETRAGPARISFSSTRANPELETGHMSKFTTVTNIKQSNGVIHVIDRVLLPK